LLAGEMSARGISTLRISFPRYDSFCGELAGRYLNGDFGPLEAVDPHLSSMLYAADRMEAKPEMEAALAVGTLVLADRYVGSNLAHQTARVAPDKREEFLAWLKRLEYGIFGLPAEDLVIYLQVPIAEAHRLVGLKSARAYTTMKRDIHEADVTHLEQTAAVYDRLATGDNWTRIECVDSRTGGLLSPEEIHKAVMQAVDTRIRPVAPARH
jgi:dTMP kinase